MEPAEIWTVRTGPDGLSKITRSIRGRGVIESWTVPSDEVDLTVLALWAEEYERQLGFLPAWFCRGV